MAPYPAEVPLPRPYTHISKYLSFLIWQQVLRGARIGSLHGFHQQSLSQEEAFLLLEKPVAACVEIKFVCIGAGL